MLVGIFLLFLANDIAMACWGYSHYPASTPPTLNITGNLTISSKDAVGRNINQSWGGWTPPPNIGQQWALWLQTYNESLKATKAPKEYVNERQDWPYSWKDVGGGNAGVPPPPWAFSPRHTGLPDFCYLSPEGGNCTEKITRWGFNPYTNECATFIYSGCGENRNSFLEKLRCEQACMHEPISGCETEAHIYPEDINND